MDTSSIQPRHEVAMSPATAQQVKNLGGNEPPLESRSDNDQDDILKAPQETVNLSDTSLKLSTSSPVKSSDQATAIVNPDQAQQVLSQLIANIQSNPSQGQAAHSNIFDGAVKSLLG
jgi:hypothetical protein